ncbi:putative DNA helicase [Helianthus anomalus]
MESIKPYHIILSLLLDLVLFFLLLFSEGSFSVFFTKSVLKVGVPIMLLRNIDQKNGLCNGTRLKVISLGNRVIEAEVISGSNIGARIFVPRIGIIPSDKKVPFRFQRRQFPVALCFAMTINKSQGQSLSRVGLFMKNPVFSHGQLYVALSRVKSRDGLKLSILDNDGNLTNRTSNVVYKEVFTCNLYWYFYMYFVLLSKA